MSSVTLSQKAQLTTEAARAIAEAAAAEARQQNLNMSIAIVDDGGYLLYFVRMSEKIAPASAQVAVERRARRRCSNAQRCRGRKPPRSGT